MAEAPTNWHEVHRPPHGTDAMAVSGYEVPPGYGEDKLTLLVRDPECVFSFWEVTDDGWRSAVARMPVGESTPELVLRVYDLTGTGAGTNWTESQARGYADFHVAGASSWYVHLETPGLVLAAAIGAKRNASFVPIARSHVVATPPGRVSDHWDADWMTVEELYRYVTRMPVGASSPDVDAAVARRRQLELSSGFGVAIAHPGFSPGFSPGFHARTNPTVPTTFRRVPRGSEATHAIHVAATVTLYGRVSDPTAIVTVAGERAVLEKNGQFRVHLPLPDGTHVLPVEVRFSDDTRSAVTPVISRETYSSGNGR